MPGEAGDCWIGERTVFEREEGEASLLSLSLLERGKGKKALVNLKATFFFFWGMGCWAGASWEVAPGRMLWGVRRVLLLAFMPMP